MSAHVWMHPLVLGIFGAMIGSFLNVVIYRVPRGMSIVNPPSSCTSCSARIKPWDKVPVLSWIILGGKCRTCKTRISPRYPLIEGATALVFAGCGRFLPDPSLVIPALLFSGAMIAVTFIDLDHRIIPDAITYPGLAIALILSFTGISIDPAHAFWGALAGGGSLFLVAWCYRVVTGRDGLGGGDIKLLAMVGAFLGPVGAALTILFGSLAGTLFAIATMKSSGLGLKSELPFGTFLAPCAVLVLFVGARLFSWYWNLFL
jgi:leader peptidase (prepilin peptidase)/N-methyltransferase